MGDFRSRPNGTYIFEAEWQDLYVLTEHWKSDLLFYKDDLRFLDHLIDKYFIWLTKKENIDQVRAIEESLIATELNCSKLIKRIKTHIKHLAELIDNPFAYDSHKFRTEHQILEDDFTKFIKLFRKNRQEVFKITEHVIDTEELSNHLIR
jgi:hypothetical protein